VFLHVGLNPFLLNERSVSSDQKHKAASANLSIAGLVSARARCQVPAVGRVARCAGLHDTRVVRRVLQNVRLANTGGDVRAGTVGHQRGKYDDAALADEDYLYSPRNYGEQARIRKVAIPKVLKGLLMFLLQNVSIRNSSPNPELELPRNNLLKRLFGWNTV
jgi:hypothetical protein